MMHYLVKVKNETPLIINYSSGNYYRSLDYIPSSSIIGALKAKILADKKIWGGENREELKMDLYVTDAYPSTAQEKQLNPPSLVTLYKKNEIDDYFIDGAKVIIETYQGKKKWGEEIIRLKKGPRHWYMKNGNVYPIQIERISTNILKLDDELKIAYQETKNNEKTGYLAHIESISPGNVFAFEAIGSEDQLNFLIDTLKEGIFVGSFKTKGYGFLKLLNYSEINGDKKSKNSLYILDFYGNVSYKYFQEIKSMLKRVIFESIGIDKRKRLNYNEWITDYTIRSGSVIIAESDRNLYELETESIIKSGGGKIVINHPVHGL
jgi:hypothetical protein